MSRHALTLNVPAELFIRIKQSADESQHSIEEELLEKVTSAFTDPTIPRELAGIIASLSSLNDAELWQAARSQLTAEASQELGSLHEKQQCEGLSSAEQQRAAELERLFDRLILLRSQAAMLLKQRGHDVSVLLGS